jgi:hypothetical protein
MADMYGGYAAGLTKWMMGTWLAQVAPGSMNRLTGSAGVERLERAITGFQAPDHGVWGRAADNAYA